MILSSCCAFRNVCRQSVLKLPIWRFYTLRVGFYLCPPAAGIFASGRAALRHWVVRSFISSIVNSGRKPMPANKLWRSSMPVRIAAGF